MVTLIMLLGFHTYYIVIKSKNTNQSSWLFLGKTINLKIPNTIFTIERIRCRLVELFLFWQETRFLDLDKWNHNLQLI